MNMTNGGLEDRRRSPASADFLPRRNRAERRNPPLHHAVVPDHVGILLWRQREELFVGRQEVLPLGADENERQTEPFAVLKRFDLMRFEFRIGTFEREPRQKSSPLSEHRHLPIGRVAFADAAGVPRSE
jgi:hypothetical protein